MADVNILQTSSYLSFRLGDEAFAANTSKVLSILEMTKITEVPQAPHFMKGIINLRGKVLPIIDIRMKFGMTPTVYTSNTCIVVMDIAMETGSVELGVLVDSVESVLEIERDKVLEAPSIGSRYKADFIEGVIHEGDNFIMLLDIDKIFSSLEIVALNQSAAERGADSSIEIVG